MTILTPTFLIRSPIIFIANILVHGASGEFTLLLLLLFLLLLFPVTPPTTLFPTNCKQEKRYKLLQTLTDKISK